MHPCANRLGPLADHPLLILLRGFPQQNIQFFPTRYLRHRHQMVAAKITTFALHATLLVAFPWRTKLRRKTPVRPEGHESRGLFALISPQNLLHRTLQVIVAKRRKYSAEIGERQLVGFEKSLLTGVRERAMEGSSAGHTPHAKQISLLPLSADLCVGFIPVHLCFCAPRIRLRNEGLATGQP